MPTPVGPRPPATHASLLQGFRTRLSEFKDWLMGQAGSPQRTEANAAALRLANDAHTFMEQLSGAITKAIATTAAFAEDKIDPAVNEFVTAELNNLVNYVETLVTKYATTVVVAKA